jgi:hypothetical protein
MPARFLVSLFSSEKADVSATGTWTVAAENARDALSMARFYADPQYWPPGSTWLCVPLDDGSTGWEAGAWDAR